MHFFLPAVLLPKQQKNWQKAVEADLYEILPAVPYTSADLNWNDKNSRSSLEMSDKASRPELKDYNAPIAGYDKIFLGFPIWWYTAPTIVRTFLEAYDFNRKNDCPFFATFRGKRIRADGDGTGRELFWRNNEKWKIA